MKNEKKKKKISMMILSSSTVRRPSCPTPKQTTNGKEGSETREDLSFAPRTPRKKEKNIYIIDNERLMMLSEQLKVLYKHLEVALYPSNLVAIILSPTIVGDINPISVTKLVMYFGST